MKKKKIISAISALAMAVSSFGAISASAITTEDIGNKFNQELAPLFKAPDYTYTFQDDGTLCSYNKYLRYYEDLGFTFDEICIPTDFSFNYSAPYGRNMFPYTGTNLIVTSDRSEEEVVDAVNSIAEDASITLINGNGTGINKKDDGRYFIHPEHTVDDVKLADVKLAEALAQSDVFTSVTVRFFYTPVEIDYIEGFTLTLKDGVTFDAEKYGLTEDDVKFDSENNSYYISKVIEYLSSDSKDDYLESVSDAVSLYTKIGQDYADDIVEYYPHNVFWELYRDNRPSFQLTKVYKTFLGDANGDNSCNVQDMILYAKHIIGEDNTDTENMVSTQSAEQTSTIINLNSESTASGIADLNGDGKVDVTDLMLIAQYISGEINKF